MHLALTKPRQRCHPCGSEPRAQASKARGTWGALASPRQGRRPLGVSGARVWPGVRRVCFGCGEEVRPGETSRKRTHGLFSPNKTPLCGPRRRLRQPGRRAGAREPAPPPGRGAPRFLGGHARPSRPSPGLQPARAFPFRLHHSLLIPKEMKGFPCPRHFGHRSALGGARPGLCGKLAPRWTVFAFGDQEV